MATAVINVIEREKVELLNRLHRECEQSYSNALEKAVDAGNVLISIKHSLRHGEFGTWLSEHFEGSDRVARQYMQLAASPELANRHDSAGLTITQAREEIARPKARLSNSEMGDVFRNAGVGAMAPAPQAELAAPAGSDRKDRRAGELLAEIREAYDQASRPGMSAVGRARAYRDAAVRAKRLSVLLDELASLHERI